MTKPSAQPLRHPEVLRGLNLPRKASLTSGANFWNTETLPGIPAIMLTDGPHGVRKQGGKADHLGLNASLPATCFPTAAALAQSWDPRLLERVGERLGTEAAAAGVAVLLGPGLNIVRNPLGGRSFEYFSEDPRLSGDLAAAMVRGIQSTGIAACPKHFAVNSQEHLRMSIDEVVDERSLREIYLEGFRRVVEQAHPRVLMTAYNKVNGTHANENTHLLRDILRGEWGFEGVVVTDWGGNHDRVAGLRAGNQLEMPSTGGVTDAEIVAAVRSGDLDEATLDRAVDDVVALALDTTAALADPPQVDPGAQHHAAVEAARRCLVLLRNAPAGDGRPILPLHPGARVAVVGDFAATPRYQGAGSSLVNPTRVDDALSALRTRDVEVVGFARGFHRFGRRSRKLAREALALAARAETVLLFLGLDESSEAEGVDREHLRLPADQLALLGQLTRAHERVVVVLAGGAPVELPFADDVAAILHTSLAGQGGGTAVAEVLTGAVEPTGRLAVTFPVRYADVPSARAASPAAVYPGRELTSEHRDGLFVGYRYYSTRHVPVRYPFGHGLGYTTFDYTDLDVDLGPTGGVVACTLRNTGDRPGREVVQVYTGPRAPEVPHPRAQLAGFASVALGPGEERRVEIAVDSRAVEYYDPDAARWLCPGGAFLVEVGASVEDIRLSTTVEVERGPGVAPLLPDAASAARRRAELGPYATGDVQRVDDDAFAALLGRPAPPSSWDRSAPLGLDDTVAQLRHTNLLGRAVLRVLTTARRLLMAAGRPLAANNVMFLVNMPFAKIEGYTAGKVRRHAIEGFLRLVNR
ncbi:glycoside hydrolase family 3 C-terminal domain-containing protein [Myceligenerans pegani]|uniref:Glycoside hydrolase family 3 C-terminal domain-containing protein n=1 Tax=Myceligenerans pegani TaxID=2776917 RepID=A0ABR9N3N7_9MICO|nr:glycoside hydrolase family 3 C-terminal domain-containing protein [Myceligenerans sp. TRM 65318]MBE1878283.1 glycoside hydrolase family 3 C-terminal domain-containing protein [Myceligenerans sp. TRM 65318]MBE3020554.1 glycoside hydrolase family 3 C-terminal domain-containing protein [Myceligenerans sp. TRM 65318]